jgi:hypothetical protein
MKTRKVLEAYDNKRFGPILGVSDEGSAAPTIAYAAYNSAKALAIGHGADEMCVGVIIDGERMGSAGEVPVGPEEYADFFPAAEGRTFCTTNVGVRVNTRIHQPYPEFPVADAAGDEKAWVKKVFAKFEPFIHTPDGRPRPLTVRLTVKSDACLDALRSLVPKIEAGRTGGPDTKIGPPDLHRLSFLIEFEDEIGANEIEEIRKLIMVAADLKVPEVAVDGKLREAARRRISIQGLLNVLDEETARTLLGEAGKLGVALVYHFEVDRETAARTVWTGLNSARREGLTAAKYGLFPLTLRQQKYVVHNIQRWMADDWTPIPAFYVDTPFVTDDDVYGSDRVADACKIWLDMVAEEGVEVVLIDAPDRIVKHRLLKSDGGPGDIGVLTLDQVEPLTRHAESLGIKALWSGGVKPEQAFELGKIGVAGIFTTGSTAHAIAVHGTMLVDEQLAKQAEPTDVGVRRIHALLQAGYLCRVLGSGNELVPQIEQGAAALLKAGMGNEAKPVIDALNELLIRGWLEHWSD